MKKMLSAILAVGLSVAMLTGCNDTASSQRAEKDRESNEKGGLERTVKVYDYEGKLMKEYEGLIDIDSSEGGGAGRVKFDLNGKRTMIYGGIVIVDEK
ncbi:hypothetical protein M3_0098 [Lysinibacillus phage vB_LfM_LysYB1]|nr:hypothetical protein M3_0098 [Lysinibacillus phage vB_LfM_LysYB1]WAB25393.1 hypothetical protein M5_0215 [Lysinibacillus phage vB_LfM_LysYB2]